MHCQDEASARGIKVEPALGLDGEGRVARIDRAAQALVVAEGYQRIGARALVARLSSLEERSEAK
jgi:hypothetical protein